MVDAAVPYGTVLLTGAAGNIGSVLRSEWEGRFPVLRVTDVRKLGLARSQEEVVEGDLTVPEQAFELVRGADAIVHLAAIPEEDTFPRLLEANVLATFNVFEAARLHGTRRIVFASTNHVTGFYPSTEQITPTDPFRPDTLYGVTKAFGELLGRLYHDKFGLEVVCIRIGSFATAPANRRKLSTWLSPRDASQLFLKALTVVDIGFFTIYGVSRTERPYWINDSGAALLGYSPDDEAEVYAAEIDDSEPRERQGGFYTLVDCHGGGVEAPHVEIRDES
jgi:uronate dehydrogenase